MHQVLVSIALCIKFMSKFQIRWGFFSTKNCWYFSYFSMYEIIYCGYLLDAPRRGAANEYPHTTFFLGEIKFFPDTPSYLELCNLQHGKRALMPNLDSISEF